MKTKKWIHPASFFFLLSWIVIFTSWVGSGYGWRGVQNLLSVDGIRWILRSAEENFMHSPALAVVCILFFGCGLVVDSGFGDALLRLVGRERKLSRKQKRAMFFSALVEVVYIGICCLLVWGPWGIVRSVTGMFEGSPLQDGFLVVVSLGVGILGTVYGFAVDNYRRDKDVYRGMACLFGMFAEYFVSLFFIVQFFAALQYSGISYFLGIPVEFVYCFYIISCIYPFFLDNKRVFLH